ncbi:hypothetical protein HKCCE3408_01120 [Rhodobacterales bacterium HKCCE3408]|nr:hypothetical protein [Rhodobacterales bacterium HKCCE3408]
MTAPRLIAIGTHHKTGTVWMRRVFNFFTDGRDIPRIRIGGHGDDAQVPAEGRAVLVSWVSGFSPALLSRADLRGLHMIRDPRDVLISGLRYHQIAPEGGEKWLHMPRVDLDGSSYQSYLKSRATLHDKFLFEMQGVHAQTLADMMAWDYTRPNIREIRYEDLRDDHDMSQFSDHLDFLGIEGEEKDFALDCYWQNSLFGGMAKKDDRPRRVSLHIQSGEAAQWISRMPRSVAEIYAERHGQALIALGYETDTSWVERCPDDVPETLLSGQKG